MIWQILEPRQTVINGHIAHIHNICAINTHTQCLNIQTFPMTNRTRLFRLILGQFRTIAQRRERLARLAAALDAMSPLKVLGRGYAIARKEDGALLTSSAQTEPGERLSLRLAKGTVTCRVEETD